VVEHPLGKHKVLSSNPQTVPNSRSPILCAPDITHHKEHTQLRLTVHSPGTPETHPMRCETAEMPGTDPLLPVFCLMNDLLRLAVCLAEATEAQS
jgi:hypothetical protein